MKEFCIISTGIALLILGLLVGHTVAYKTGYVDALADLKYNRPPKYKLETQTDGSSIWVSNYEDIK